ncbi:hypothetical protein GOP47_0022450 [Adiantum capillus-veneris]|uniref:Transmembrane protein n=1 Tax=Adiantum capillus-veneris TaxID=13818 RepID=A0A9D4U5E4_ADICA|nr:hypothetical protein GOP47_0022450 [Adiantum capillus-veneris]
MSKEVENSDLRVAEVELQSNEISFSEELWNACNECCDLKQFFCCIAFIAFVLGVFASILAILIYFRPVDVKITIDSVKVNNYTVIKRIEENNQSYYAVYVVAYIDFVFLATNPSKKYTVVYSNSTFQCLTRDMSLGMFTTSAFRQAPFASTNWTRVLLLDVPEPVPSALRAPIIQDAYVNDVVILQIEGAMAARFEVGGIYFPSLENVLNCTVKFNYSNQSNAIFMGVGPSQIFINSLAIDDYAEIGYSYQPITEMDLIFKQTPSQT